MAKPFNDYRTTEVVTAHIRDELISGRLAAATRIDLDELAQNLDVSRTPIREALLRLEAEGFIERRPYRGAVVASIDPCAVEEVFALRIHNEGLAAALGAARLSDDHVVEMKAALDEMQQAEGTISGKEYSRINWRFHSALYRAADAPLLLRVIEPLTGQAERISNMYRVPRDNDIAAMHPAILDACREHDGARAESVMRQHILKAFAALSRRNPRLTLCYEDLRILPGSLGAHERELLRAAFAANVSA